ncbi:MAG: ABC transporter substrate-binding protein [Gammaproteobacteria bacterium]|nr:ABC transporter substrate-binding protein [Gammaproteobacteria bacterium]
MRATSVGRMAGLLLAALVVLGPGYSAAESVTVVSWGGSYADACEAAYLEPFAADTGIEVALDDYNGGLSEIRSQVEAGNVHWDIVDIQFPDLVRGCDEGLFETLDVSLLAPGADGSAPEDDFYPNLISECGLAMLFFSTIVAYNHERTTGEVPDAIQDFFDLDRFPGRRGMRRTPLANLEFALMADEVPASEVYALLNTREGVDRAFRKLDTIKDQVVWWDAGAQPPQMLADGEVVMTTAYNGRIFNAQVLEDQPFTIVWHGQVLEISNLAIVSGSANLAAARQLLAYASRPASMAAVSRYIAYSPSRYSAEGLISNHLATGVAMAGHMPNAPENTKLALRSDWSWWADNGEDMNERFGSWLVR